MTAQVIERNGIGPRTKIGQGRRGVVYYAPNVKTKFAASMVYKEYQAHALTEIDFTALAAMPALVQESLSSAQAERLIAIAAWPCALVEDASAPTGFVMPAIPVEFFAPRTTVEGVSPTTAEFELLLNHSSVLDAHGIALDDVQRYALLREVAAGLAYLHAHGVCVGDVSPKNLLFSVTPHEAVYFIDCDAMRINGVSALPQVQTPGWDTPPGEELATIYSDTYKLGLLALRLLAGDQDTTNPHHIPQTTPGLLRQIITDTLTNAAALRPLPEAWNYALGQAIEEAQHRKKTASTAAAPVAAAPAPPPIPELRSRPSTPDRTTPRIDTPPPARPLESTPGPAPARGKPKPWKLAIIAAIILLVGAGITGYLYWSPNSTPSGGPLPDATTLVKQSTDVTKNVKSAQLVLTVNGKVPGLSLKTLSGDLTTTPATAAKGKATISFGGGDVDIDFVVFNGDLYATLTPNKWSDFGPASDIYDPSQILSLNNGLANVLANFTDAKAEGRDTINGQTAIRISGKVTPAAVNLIAPPFAASQPVPATVWIQETGDHQLVQAQLEKSSGNSVQMTLSNWGEQVQVSKPAGA